MVEGQAGCSITLEEQFGPFVGNACLNGFDFTLLFEEIFLTIVPLALAVLWATQRLFYLRGKGIECRQSWLLPCKLTAYATYGILQIVLLVLWAQPSQPQTQFTIACTCLTFAGYAILGTLSCIDHRRSPRPSTLLSLFFGLSVLLHLPRVRTLFFTPQDRAIAILSLVTYFVDLAIFTLECATKEPVLRVSEEITAPEDRAGIWNRALFLWLGPLLIRGFRTVLGINTLLPLDREVLEASKSSSLIHRWTQLPRTSNNALLWSFMRHYKWAILAGVIPRLANAGFVYAQPYLVQRVLDFTSSPPQDNAQNIAYGLIAAYAICYIGIALSESLYQGKTYRLITLFRGSLVSMVYDKMLRADTVASHDAEAITLMSADVDRITSSMNIIHESYACLIELGVAIWLLYNILGLAMLPGLAWIALCALLGFPSAAAAADSQIPWLEAIQDRLAATARSLSGMKAIKTTGLANVVARKLMELRDLEITASLRHRAWNILVFVTALASSSIAPVWSLLAYALIAKAQQPSHTLTSSTAFAALSVFELLQQPASYAIHGLEDFRTVANCFQRIQEYLQSKERPEYRCLVTPMMKEDKHDIVYALERVSTHYIASSPPVLKDVTFSVPRGSMTALYGPVGSGKSTLLRLLMGEMPTMTGNITTTDYHSAYCSQTPWCFPGTIRSNIIASFPWEEEWYQEVISACALQADFDLLPEGDLTRVGLRGSVLSGGQQARVSLARALYSRMPVVLLDGVFAGLDQATEQHVLTSVLGRDGIFRQYGITAVLATVSSHHLAYADQTIVLDGKGGVNCHSSKDATQLFERRCDKGGEDEEKEARLLDERRPEIDDEIKQLLEPEGSLDKESRKSGDFKVYGFYAKIAGWPSIAVYLVFCSALVFGVVFPSIWIQWWTNANEADANASIAYWAGILGALGGLMLVSCIASEGIFNLVILPKTARRFHELLLTTTMRATTSFLTSSNAGTILNRFSQDLELIDNDLPDAINTTIFQFLSTIAASVLIFIGSGYVAAAIPGFLIIITIITLFYLRVSRQLRLLEIEARAPLFSHFLDTLQGTESIRAYNWTADYRTRNRLALDTSQRPYYQLFCVQRWLVLVLDLTNAGLAILLVGITTSVRGGATAYLGTALYNVVIFGTTVQSLVTQWTQVELALGAINRVRSYVRTAADENLPEEEKGLAPGWPAHGAVALRGVSASYRTCSDTVLHGVSLDIKAGQKVAICGRTGSGKSSLIGTLLRTVNVDAGVVEIDGADVGLHPRDQVRQALNTISQEPFFLPGTVRENLDPFDEHDSDRLVGVLKRVGLWETVFGANGGLEEPVESELLSHGQRQLFCLGRAALRPGKIVLLDEATSGVDDASAAVMMQIIQQEFADRTIIAVAHKLDEVLDFDLVVVLEAGKVKEIGVPRDLLGVEGSTFRTLYDAKDAAGVGE